MSAAVQIRKGLRFDPVSTVRELEQFVQAEVTRLNKRGVVLGLSGGLDSTVCAYLCVRALGKKRVLALILPERDSDPQNIRDAELVAQTLGLDTTRIDLTPILTQMGVYGLISKEMAANRRVLELGLRWLARLTRQPSAFSQGLALLYHSHPNCWERLAHKLLWRPVAHVYAFAISKVRLRMILLYYHAFLNDCLVVGTTDKSEWSIGFYDKYGDGANDIALLRHLYKTQVRELARYLGVPLQIVNKASSGDLAAGLPNEALIGLTYEQLDAVLWGIEQGLSDEDIARQAGVKPAMIKAVHRAMRAARIRDELPAYL
nr:NAD(+) synthase [Chloroflexota bacterium]